jgi:phage gpG-like protein
MLEISLEGQAALAKRLAALPDNLRAALAEKADALARDLFSQIVDVNLSGGVLDARSGALRDSIVMQASQDDERIGAEIFSDGDVPYAAIQEFGGKTAAHEILPEKAGVLAFLMNGKQVFARRVEHPGSQIPERSYLRSALEEQGDDITQGLADALMEIAQQVENPA